MKLLKKVDDSLLHRKTIMVDMDGVITEDGFSEICEEFLNRKIDFEGERILWRQDVIKGQEDEFREKHGKVNLWKREPSPFLHKPSTMYSRK